MYSLISTTLLLSLVTNFPSIIAQNSTSSSYAPKHVSCPTDVQWLRPAEGLNPDEAAWVQGRKVIVLDALTEYLERLGMEDLDIEQYAQKMRESNHSNVPVLAWATSGGGWASAFTGIGGLRALDARLPAAVEQKTGGLLQSLTYLAGQSGGNFPTISITMNGFPTVDELVQIWQPQINRFGAANDSQYAQSSNSIFLDIEAKAKAGFNVSISDYFARAFGAEFVPGQELGADTTFSSLLDQDTFKDFAMPMPMALASEVKNGDTEYFGLQLPATNGSADLYEMTPFEFGAWQGSKSFTPMKWVGTRLVNGQPIDNSSCVNGFDNAGFIIGSAASAENFWLIEGFSNDTIAPFSKRSDVTHRVDRRQAPSVPGGYIPHDVFENTVYLAQVFKQFGLNTSNASYAPYPNPFYGYQNADSSNRKDLTLVDATEVGQAVPFWGLIQPARTADLIFAWEDDSSTYYSWNNGTNIRDTYLAAKIANLSFPIIPSINTMINKGFNRRPTFFGCNANLTTNGDTSSPIVTYLANAPYSAYTNYSGTQTTFDFGQMNEIFVNSFDLLTGGNSTLDQEWPVCLGCAAIDRSLTRVGIARTAQCEACMQKYCWDGSLDDSDPGIFDPRLVLDPSLGFAEWNATRGPL